MEAYLIVLIVVLTIILLGVNFYLLALYVHPDDKGWGTALYCKILVILGLPDTPFSVGQSVRIS